MQTVSSMNTSVNTTRLPSIWGKINWKYVKIHAHNPNCPIVVDYGCGKPQTAQMARLVVRNNYIDKERLGQFGCHYGYFPYDPYWGDISSNETTLRCLTEYKEADLCICANVLNVIDDKETVEKIINDVTQAQSWVFQIYFGDGSGQGKYTKNHTCYQANQKLSYWVRRIMEVTGKSVYYKENYIFNNLNSIIFGSYKRHKQQIL